MNPSSLLFGAACLAVATPALAQQAPGALPTVKILRELPVSSACPNVFTALPKLLSKAAYDIGEPAEVMIQFTIAGDQLSELRTQSSHWAFGMPVRQAVRRLGCHAPDQAAYSVRFRLVFQYGDSPDASGQTVQLPPDFSPAMVRR